MDIRKWLLKRIKGIDLSEYIKVCERLSKVQIDLDEEVKSKNRLLIENILYENGIDIRDNTIRIEPVRGYPINDGMRGAAVTTRIHRIDTDNIIPILIDLATSGYNYDMFKRNLIIGIGGQSCRSLQDIREKVRY